MNKKVIGLAVASVALVTTIAVGGTLAWFTSKGTTKNVVTTGNVQIALAEPVFSAEHTNNTIANVIPGQVIQKDPTIRNTGNNDAYIRAKIEIKAPEGSSLTSEQITSIAGLLQYNIDDSKWKKGTDGYYYYVADTNSDGNLDGVFHPTANPLALFTQVTVPGATWTNALANLSFDVDVTAEAIQVANFTGFDATAANPSWGGATAE